MKNSIITSNGMEIQLVRYFSFQGKNYLFFIDDQQLDAEGHVTINMSEVNTFQGLTANAVGSDYETLKNVIKDIVKENRNNMPLTISDLNYTQLNGINIIGSTKLKLMENFVNILMQNQPQFESAPVQNNVANEPVSFASLQPEQSMQPIPNPVVDEITPVVNSYNTDLNPFQPIQPTQETPVVGVGTQDYQKMYLEQVELIKNLQNEVEAYKNKFETIKNIINN